MKVCWLVVVLFFSATTLRAQLTERVLQTTRTTESITIDGIAKEAAWQTVQPASQFTQIEPVNGAPSAYETEVRVLYDNEALYIFALLKDNFPDSILTQLGRRDAGQINADQFGLYLDTYKDRQNAYGFEVSAAGVQTDMRWFNTNNDYAWDAVWSSKEIVTEAGWQLEMRIPYSAIRFPNTPIQNWGINFSRNVRRKRENSFWNFVDNSKQGFVNQFGTLSGIENVIAPLRLSLTPYVSSFAQHNGTVDGPSKVNYNISGGMDVKYGLNESFTLDVTLVPDFRQVQSDNQVLNLSPYEVRFNENRPFFTEGTELFNKGELFYSRRIGGRPLLYYKVAGGNDKVIDNPLTSRLINAAKITGRTESKLGIGLFNAITRNTFATVEDSLGNRREILTDPSTNYNLVVLDQALPNNSFVTFTNTNVTRSHNFYNANVTGLQLRQSFKNNKYAIRASGNLSQRFDKYFAANTVELGHQYMVRAAKVSGTWQYSLQHSVMSHTFNPNDLGYLPSNNSIDENVSLSYNMFQPKWKFLTYSVSTGASYSQLYYPRRFTGINNWINGYARFRNFLSAGFYMGVAPVKGYNYFEARVPNHPYLLYPSTDGSFWVSSDYRKKFAYDVSVNYWLAKQYGQKSFTLNVSPRLRLSDKFSVISGFQYNPNFSDIGFVGFGTDEQIYFGSRKRDNYETTLTGAYIFTARSALNLNLRHYWSVVDYKQFYSLQANGVLQPDSNFTTPNINSNIFNIDLVYSWRLAPGSEMSIVYKNSIFSHSNYLQEGYFTNIGNTVRAPQSNSLSFKLLYYLDYRTVQKAWRT